MGRAGVVARDHRGLCLFSEGRQLTDSRSVEAAEAKAALMGLQSLLKVFRGHIVLEMDCLALGRELKPDAPGRSPLFGLVMDIRERHWQDLNPSKLI